jgi:signal transduction histidine kinase
LKSVSKEDLEDIIVSENLENILNKFQTSIKEKNIKVEFNKRENVLLKANKTDIEVCFTNLIDNAVKYNIKDGVI